MNKISKQQADMRHAIANALRDRFSDLEAAVRDFNEAVAEKTPDVTETLVAYNDAVRDANEFRDNILTEAQGYFDEKSEKWQEGERGSAYQAWINEWEDDFEEAEVEFPDAIDDPESTAADDLENLPDEP